MTLAPDLHTPPTSGSQNEDGRHADPACFIESHPAVRGAPTESGVDIDEACHFLELFHAENPGHGPCAPRVARVRAEIAATGSYQHTGIELAFGARRALRHIAPESGLPARTPIQVRDLRHVSDAAAVAAECAQHLRLANGRGQVQPLMSVFAPDRPGNDPAAGGPRIRNEHLVEYAGHPVQGGRWPLGDAEAVGFTARVRDMGWRPTGGPGPFDVLPLMIDAGDQRPRLFSVPKDVVLEVLLEHPEYTWFSELNLRWNAVRTAGNASLRIGGVCYPCAPFNGWQHSGDIARQLADPQRRPVASQVAERLGLDASSEDTLWRDRAALEIQRAVRHSFQSAGIPLADWKDARGHGAKPCTGAGPAAVGPAAVGETGGDQAGGRAASRVTRTASGGARAGQGLMANIRRMVPHADR